MLVELEDVIKFLETFDEARSHKEIFMGEVIDELKEEFKEKEPLRFTGVAAPTIFEDHFLTKDGTNPWTRREENWRG